MTHDRARTLAVLVAALGYFVDIYDLLLFSVVRVASLQSLGRTEEQILSDGILLINMQMTGLIVGAFLWGILGDKRGRITVLFGSILLYSVANILNGFVQSVESYAVLRLLAGIGLAGELGAGITLVSEICSKNGRGVATTIVAATGLAGAVVASLVGDLFSWRVAYIIGGVMGLALLFLRISVHESGMFNALSDKDVSRGNLALLFTNRERMRRFLCCVLLGMPICFGVYLFMTFSPEIGKALGMVLPPVAGQAILYTYCGLVVGDVACGLLSQKLQSRKKSVFAFLVLAALVFAVLLGARALSQFEFYCLAVVVGFSIGYWAVLITTTAEQFGTNLRATVTTVVPNLIRGAAIPMTLTFRSLEPVMGKTNGIILIGIISFLLAGLALVKLRETFGRDLDFVER